MPDVWLHINHMQNLQFNCRVAAYFNQELLFLYRNPMWSGISKLGSICANAYGQSASKYYYAWKTNSKVIFDPLKTSLSIKVIQIIVFRILQSKNPKYPVGSYVFGNFGWRSHTVVKPGTNVLPYEQKDRTDIANLLPDFGNLPRSLALGYLGMPG